MPNDKEELKVVSGTEWRERIEAGEVVQLAPGFVVRVRRPSLLMLMKTGRIPDSLSALVQGLIAQGTGDRKWDYEGTTEMIALGEFLCRLAIVDPKIVENPQANNEIGMEHVPVAAKLNVISHIQENASQLIPFRQKPAGDVEAVSGDDGVQPEAEPDNGD